jgi:hypothetical protein
MRRISLLCVLAALLFAMPARAATTTQILRDCTDDGVLEGQYTTAELRKARKHLPTDVAEYSDCADLLTRAIDASTAGSGGPPASTPPSGGGASASTPGHSASRKLSQAPTPHHGLDIPVSGAATLQDQAAVGKVIADSKGQPVDVGGKSVSPGRLASAIVPPTTVLVVLALLAAALLAAYGPQIRRVVARRRRSS